MYNVFIIIDTGICLLNPQVKNKIISSYPQLAPYLEMKENNTYLKKIVESQSKDKNRMKLIKGERGDKGEDGKTPIKGKDYFTEKEIEYFATEILKLATPIKGKHYFDGQKGDSVKGDKGERGLTGKKGEKGDQGRDGSEITSDEIVSKLNGLKGSLKSHVIEDLPTIGDFVKEIKNPKSKYRLSSRDINMNDMRWHGGGLSIVTTDSTLTGLGTTSSPLSVVGGGSGLTILPAIGTINNINTSFTFTVLPTLLVINGALNRQTGDSITWTWNTGTLTATLSSSVGTGGGIFGIR